MLPSRASQLRSAKCIRSQMPACWVAPGVLTHAVALVITLSLPQAQSGRPKAAEHVTAKADVDEVAFWPGDTAGAIRLLADEEVMSLRHNLRLGQACGAKPETISGLSGLGDLVLSCSSAQSRNFSYGMALGRGETPARDKLSEGEFTAPVLVELAREKKVDMPVASAVAAVLASALTVNEAIETLLTRPFKAEG